MIWYRDFNSLKREQGPIAKAVTRVALTAAIVLMVGEAVFIFLGQ